jgi:hypothetical protein
MTAATGRYADEVFPHDYASWRYCIEVKCGLALTPEFLQARIAVLEKSDDQETRRFVKLYGADYLAQVLVWFRQASAET